MTKSNDCELIFLPKHPNIKIKVKGCTICGSCSCILFSDPVDVISCHMVTVRPLNFAVSCLSGLPAESHVQQRGQRRPVEQTVPGNTHLDGRCGGGEGGGGGAFCATSERLSRFTLLMI